MFKRKKGRKGQIKEKYDKGNETRGK